MSYPRTDMPLRTNESFRARAAENHHKMKTPLEDLPINMIDDFPISDSLHLFDLGIMKRCLLGWIEGKYSYSAKWSAQDIRDISKLLLQSNKSIPNEIHRKMRALDTIHFWKATEFRTFLLYILCCKSFCVKKVFAC